MLSPLRRPVGRTRGLLELPVLGALAIASAAGAASAAPRLTEIRAVRALSPEEAARGYRVHLRGVVTHLDEARCAGLVLHDGVAGQFVLTGGDLCARDPAHRVQTGDRVEIEGRTARGGFAPNVVPETLRVLGRGPLPAPRRLSLSALLSGRHDCESIEIDGVGQRAWLAAPPFRTLFLDLAVEGGTLRLSFWDFEEGDLTRLIDARLRLRGVVGALFGPAGQLRGVAVFGGHTRDVVVLEAAPDPLALAVRPINSLFQFSPTGEGDRRVRVTGTVTGRSEGRPVDVADYSTGSSFRYLRHILYIRDETGALRVETEQATPVGPGDRVDVVGFPVVTPTQPGLQNAVLRRVGRTAEPQAAALAPESALAPEHDAHLVAMQGQLLGVVAGPNEDVLVVKAGELVFSAALDARHTTPHLRQLRPGSHVAVTGVYTFQWGPPPSFRLLLRDAADVRLLATAPWWTFRHTLVLLVIVALIAAAAALWVRVLLNRNALVAQQAQAVASERSRLARELHDTLEQGLAGLKLQLEAVDGSLEASPTLARHSLGVARQMLRHSLEEARRSVMDLRPQALEGQDLVGALEDLARQMSGGTGVVVEVRSTGARRRLDPPVEHQLLRIGQEALTNALKHSGADRVELIATLTPETLTLTVTDDGCGFDPAALDGAAGAHFGLRGIRERVHKLGGTLAIERLSAPSGTRLVVAAPARVVHTPGATAPEAR